MWLVWHTIPLCLLWTKPRRCLSVLDETILPNHSDFHLVTGDSPLLMLGACKPFLFPFFNFFLIFSFFVSSFLVLSFLASVKRKLKPSIVPPWFKLVKKWTHLQLNNLFDFHSISLLSLGCVPLITTIPLADHTLSLGCFILFEEQLQCVVLLASLFT